MYNILVRPDRSIDTTDNMERGDKWLQVPALSVGTDISSILGINTLSPRQLEIAQLISEGYSEREIARILGINSRNVWKYKQRIKAKLAKAMT